MQHSLKVKALVLALLMTPDAAPAQTARTDPRRIPPAAQLGLLKPFLGEYEVTMTQQNRVLTGTMEIKTAINGFYIERTNITKSTDGAIDSEIRSFITWDPALGSYRIWRFVALLPQRKHDGVGRFEGQEFIEEYDIEGVTPQVLRNRVTMVGTDQIRIVNEIQHADGRISLRGVIVGRRIRLNRMRNAASPRGRQASQCLLPPISRREVAADRSTGS